MNESDNESSHNRLETLLRKHIIFIVGLLCIQFFSRDIWKIYYGEFQKPYMLRAGASLCQAYVPILPEYLPPKCDIALIKTSNNMVEETFYANQGEVRVRLYSQNGTYVNQVSTMIGNTVTLILPLVGFIGLGISTLHKIIRTGAFFTWELYKRPDDPFEQTLKLYSWPLFLSGFVFH